MAAHYLKVSEETGGKIKSREAAEAATLLDEEMGNLRTGMEWAQEQDAQSGCEMVRDYALALADYFDLRGLWDEKIRWGEAGIEACQKWNDEHGIAALLNNNAIVYWRKGEWERAIEFYQKSLETKEKVGDIHGMAQTWGNLGFLYEAQGEYEWALDYLERSREVLKEIGAYEAAQVEEGVRRVRGKVG